VTVNNNRKNKVCFSRIRLLGNYHDIALVNRIVDIVVIMTHHGFFKTKGDWRWYIRTVDSGHRPLSSFSSHSRSQAVQYSFVLNSILKSVENRHFDSNICILIKTGRS